jgi:hypothetical protein
MPGFLTVDQVQHEDEQYGDDTQDHKKLSFLLMITYLALQLVFMNRHTEM